MDCPVCSAAMVEGEVSVRRRDLCALFGRWAVDVLRFTPAEPGGGKGDRTILEPRTRRPAWFCPSCGASVLAGPRRRP
ncbi:MAG: PF20097 family protein [Planctomycetes bacterium]|jgi:hypothetical protein|nr:PF20097 family protein [Planctomycetota bacterium]